MAASAEAETAATEASEEVNEAEKAEGESENAELEAQAEKDVDSKTAEEAKAQEKKDA
jgi:hypothetical protein